MPQNAAVIRQWTLLRGLEAARPGATVKELARELHVTTRTIMQLRVASMRDYYQPGRLGTTDPSMSGAQASWLRYNVAVAHGLSDTDSDTARVHLELLRRASPAARLRLALSLTRTTLSLSRAMLAKNLPGVSPQEVGLRFAARLYGQSLADEIRADLVARTP